MAGLNHEQSLSYAAERLLNPQTTEEPKETDEATSPEDEDTTTSEREEVEDNDQADTSEDESQEDSEEEDDEEEGDASEDSEESDEEEDEGDEDTELEKFTVKVNGEEVQVDADELVAGYQRNADYTQKTQALSAEKKELEEIKADLETQRDQYVNVNKQFLAQEAQVLQQYETLDWAALQSSDPLGYVEKRAEYMEAQRQVQLRVQQIQNTQHQMDQQRHEQMGQTLEQENAKLLEVLPESAKPEWKEALSEYAKKNGYTDEDLGQLVRAADVITLHKAMQYDQLNTTKQKLSGKKAPAPTKKRIKSKSPTGKSTKQARAVKAKRESLRKSGSLKDAAALLGGS